MPVLRGTVLDEARAALVGYTVKGESETITGSKTLLFQATTDANGFTKTYAEPQGSCVRLVVTVLDTNTFEVASRTVISPADDQVVDFVIGGSEGAAPLYADITTKLAAALGETSVGTLDETGVARASLCAGVEPLHAGLAREADAADALSGVPGAAFFALGMAEMPPRVADVVKHSSAERRRAFNAAVSAGVLTQAQVTAATAGLLQLDELELDSALQIPNSIASPGLAFSLAGIATGDQRPALEAWRAHQGDTASYWTNAWIPRESAAGDVSAWTKVGTPGEVSGLADPDGGAGGVTTSDDDVASREGHVLNGSYAIEASTRYRATFAVLKDADVSRFPEVRIARSTDEVQVSIGTQSGDMSVRSVVGFTNVAVSSETHPLSSKWWLFHIEFDSNLTGAPKWSVFPAHASAFGGSDDTATGAMTWYPGGCSLAESFSLGEADQGKLQYALQLSALTRGHVPLIQALHPQFTALAGLAAFERWNWDSAVATSGVPAHLTSAGLDGDYAAAMFTAIEDAFPTPMLSARNAWFSPGVALTNFIGGNPDYDLAGMSFREFTRQNPGALAAAGTQQQQDDVAAELPILERLYRISPRGQRFEVMQNLRTAGLTSATQIASMGRTQFISLMSSALSTTVSEQVFRSARSLSAAALTLQMRHRATAPFSGMAVLPVLQEGRPDVGSDTIGWEELFAGRSYCNCEHCQSAHGPAAYLADLLFWLNGRTTGGNHWDVLKARRPDVETLQLSCKNANTPLPTIDLINELLEDAVQGPVTVRQTTWDEAELAARPEHSNAGAYAKLAEPVPYPFEQPYLLDLDKTRTFLAAFGLERAALQAAFATGGIEAALARPETAAEILGTTRTTWAVLTGELSATTADEWGVGAAAPTTTEEIAPVEMFLRQAGVRSAEDPMTYAELEDLVRSGYVQQPGQLGISFTNTVCDIAGASLQSESLDAHLDRIAKLLRLSRTLGWSVADTDRAIEIFRESAGPGLPVESDISESLLLSLAAIAWLRRSINLGPSAILDWWGPLDTRRWAERLEDVSGPGMGRVPTSNLDSANAGGPDAEPSPFQKMVGKLDSAGIFALSNDGTELADTNNSISDYLDAVASVVGARPSALTPLVEDLGTDPKITLANLSHLRRHVQFARVLGMRTEDLLKWKTWTGIDPFASPLDAVRFASEVERQASVRLDDDAFEELIGSPGTRDLSTMTLPSVGEAMLALADEYRAGTAAGAQANGAQYLFDYNNATFTRASEASFADPRSRWAFAGTGEAVRATLPTLGSWTPTNAPSSAGGQPDPEGGHDAELSEDNSASHEWYQVSTSYALVSGAHYELRLAIKKDSDQTRFPEIQIVRGADFIHCQVNTETGASAIRAQLGFTATSFVVTTHPHDADWWLCTVGLTANAAGPLTARMLIAGGSTFGVANASATGTVTWYPKATLVETNGAAWRLSNEARIFADGSVLIEGSRTNLVGSGTGSGASEEWGGQWVATATRAANTDGDPDGGTDADQITLSAASGASNGGLAYADQAISQTIGIPYTLSGYFKSISGDGKLVIRSYPPGDADDLNLSASWERHSSTTTPTSATASGLGYGNYGWAGGAPYPGAKVIASWGLQYERGAFASSPIRTTTAAGARSPDLCRFTVDAVLAAALESEAGFTFDWWPAFSSVDARDDTNARLFDIGANHVSLYFSGTTDLTLNLYSGAADIATVTVPPWSAGDRLRVHVKIPSADTWELRVENVTTASGAVSATGSGPSISTETKVLTIGNFNTGTFYCPGVYSQMWTGDGTPPALHPERDRLIIRRAAALLSVDESLLDGLLELPFAGQAVRETIIADAGLVDGARALDPEATASIESIEALVDNQVWELVAIPSWLCRVFGLGVDDLQWLVDASGAIRGFDLQDVVLQPAIGDRYAAWSALREAARMQSVAVDGRLFDLFGDLVTGAVASASELRSELVTRTRWSAENLAAAIDDSFGGPIGGGSASAWAEPERFARLATWMELASETGADAAQMAGWGTLVWQSPGTAEPLSDYAASAAELEQALRGVWGDERWLEQMPAVREPIRQRSRSALVSRLVGDPGYAYTSSADVAESLLVDVQMGGCARTSRLKDATRTVQSFVQRVQLGREGALQLTDAESREWLWRKNYRVWEANRKIFLWPENWIQPELRRDKTPLFEQLEVALAQGDLGEEQVEGAFREYLRGLSAVAKLQTVAILREERAVGEDVYHVFARSRDVPPTYYHRSWLDGRRWTPWEKVVDAEGDHLVPVVYQRRVILFWLNISETAIQPSSSPVPDVNGSAPAPERYFKFHLSWSELRDGEWSSPRRSQAY
ncbi:MAG: neuraminidase-like domain-containing protein, partial [Polyangiaceae bacterium]